MADKWEIGDLKVGAVMEAAFWANPVSESGFRFRATHLDGKRAPKVVLCDDARVQPGVPCMVKITAIQKPARADRGAIEVAFVRGLGFRLEGVYVDPIVSKKLQILLESGLNILLDGPQGCGKTVLAKTIAKTLGLEFVFFNCGAISEASDFLASIQVRASEKGLPVTDFVRSEILLALEAAAERPQRRYLIFLDEFNRCPESARNALMPALDTTRRIYNPVENAFIGIPDNIQFIAAVNRGNQFSGTFGIDAAQLDRFAPLQMDYPPKEEEINLLRTRHPELKEALIEKIVRIACRIRESADIGAGLSMRATDEACMYLKHPLMEATQEAMLPEVLKSSICGRLPGRWNDPASEAGLAWEIVQATCKPKK